MFKPRENIEFNNNSCISTYNRNTVSNDNNVEEKL